MGHFPLRWRPNLPQFVDLGPLFRLFAHWARRGDGGGLQPHRRLGGGSTGFCLRRRSRATNGATSARASYGTKVVCAGDE